MKAAQVRKSPLRACSWLGTPSAARNKTKQKRRMPHAHARARARVRPRRLVVPPDFCQEHEAAARARVAELETSLRNTEAAHRAAEVGAVGFCIAVAATAVLCPCFVVCVRVRVRGGGQEVGNACAAGALQRDDGATERHVGAKGGVAAPQRRAARAAGHDQRGAGACAPGAAGRAGAPPHPAPAGSSRAPCSCSCSASFFFFFFTSEQIQ